MVEGTDFDKKMDQMFLKMKLEGMTEDQIMRKIIGSMNMEQGEGDDGEEELEFDPHSDEMMTKEMFKAFEDVMSMKKDDPRLADMMKSMADTKAEAL